MNKILIGLSICLFFSCNSHPYEQGKRIYKAKCSNCHMNDGSGLGELIPPLAASDWLRDNQDLLACAITKGIAMPITVNGTIYRENMKGIKLTDVELTNLINYINNEWGNQYGEVLLKDIKEKLSECGEVPLSE